MRLAPQRALMRVLLLVVLLVALSVAVVSVAACGIYQSPGGGGTPGPASTQGPGY